MLRWRIIPHKLLSLVLKECLSQRSRNSLVLAIFPLDRGVDESGPGQGTLTDCISPVLEQDAFKSVTRGPAQFHGRLVQTSAGIGAVCVNCISGCAVLARYCRRFETITGDCRLNGGYDPTSPERSSTLTVMPVMNLTLNSHIWHEPVEMGYALPHWIG